MARDTEMSAAETTADVTGEIGDWSDTPNSASSVARRRVSGQKA